MELIKAAKISNDFGLRKKFPWTGSIECTPWTQVVVDAREITFVKDQLFPLCCGKTRTIKRVENPYLWARYVLAYEEQKAASDSGCEERIVIHATSMTNALKIADMNFDWRQVRRARFGQGVSFALKASYAQKYASDATSYIIAGIPINKVNYGSYETIIPGIGFDTTTDLRRHVYVKYSDNDFYPYYIVE